MKLSNKKPNLIKQIKLNKMILNYDHIPIDFQKAKSNIEKKYPLLLMKILFLKI